MSDWVTMFSHRAEIDGPPVRGVPAEFQGAGDFFQNMSDQAQAVVDKFTDLKSADGAEEFQGETATAFAGVLEDVSGSLAVLPRVSGEAAGFLHTHVSDLETLRMRAEQGVNNALSRATAHWDAKGFADDDVATQDRILRQNRTALTWLAPLGEDPEDDITRDLHDQNIADATWLRSLAIGRRDSAWTELNSAGDDWVDIRAEEERLSKALDESLDDIRLGDLSDPGRLASVVDGVDNFIRSLPVIGDLYSGYLGIMEALVTGDLDLFLHSLSEYLGGLLTVLAVAALFTPFAPFALGVIFALSVAKFAVDTYLWNSETPHPKTGETVSGFQVVMSGIGVVAAGGGAYAAGFRSGPGFAGAAGRSNTASVFGTPMNQTTNVFTSGAQGVNQVSQRGQVFADVGTGTSIFDAGGSVTEYSIDLFSSDTPSPPSAHVVSPNVDFDFSLPGNATGTTMPAVDINVDVVPTNPIIISVDPVVTVTTAPVTVPQTAPVTVPQTAPVTIPTTAPVTVPEGP